MATEVRITQWQVSKSLANGYQHRGLRNHVSGTQQFLGLTAYGLLINISMTSLVGSLEYQTLSWAWPLFFQALHCSIFSHLDDGDLPVSHSSSTPCPVHGVKRWATVCPSLSQRCRNRRTLHKAMIPAPLASVHIWHLPFHEAASWFIQEQPEHNLFI